MTARILHGTENGYQWGCREKCCRAGKAAAQKRRVERWKREGVPGTVLHGKLSTYTNYGCRCADCSQVRQAYRRSYKK